MIQPRQNRGLTVAVSSLGMLIWPANSWVFWLAVGVGAALFLRYGVFPRRGEESSGKQRAEPPRTRLYILGAIAGGLVVVCAVVPTVVFAALTGAGIVAQPTDVWMWSVAAVLGLAAFGAGSWALWADRPRGRKRCPRCWYDMAGSPDLRCSECGKTAASERKLYKTRRRWKVVLLAVVMMLVALPLGVIPLVRQGTWANKLPDVVILALAPIVTGYGQLSREIDQRITEDDFAAANADPSWIRALALKWMFANGFATNADPIAQRRTIYVCFQAPPTDERSIARIIAMIASPDANVSQFAMMWTSQHAQDDPAAAALIESWLVSGDLAKTRVATMGLAGGWTPDITSRPVDPQLVALSKRPEQLVREAAAQYAGWFAHDFETQEWRRQLLSDESAKVRSTALGSICYRSVDARKFDRYRAEALDALRYGTDDMAAQLIWGLASSDCHSERLWRAVPERLSAINPTRRLDLVREIAVRSSAPRIDVMLFMAEAPELRAAVAQSLPLMFDHLEHRHLERMRTLRDNWLAAGDTCAAEFMSQTINAAEERLGERETKADGARREP